MWLKSLVTSPLVDPLVKLVDPFAKLLAAGAVVFAAYVAANYESKMTAATLLSQRERAETDLRSSMFTKLIDPIARPQAKEIDPERERVLVELLALNFHEHIELKSLMLDVDERLTSTTKPRLSPRIRNTSRASLRSVATRVIDRQVALLGRAESDEGFWRRLKTIFAGQPTPGRPSTVEFNLLDASATTKDGWQRECQDAVTQFVEAFQKGPGYFVGHFIRMPNAIISETFDVTSPDGQQTLTMSFHDPDWENETFKVQIATRDERQFKFTVTRFDFPFTDNTLLSDGNRFAVFIDRVTRFAESKELEGWKAVTPELKLRCEGIKEINTAWLKLAWFPKDYFSPRERPINYREFREKLGLKIKQD